MNMIRLTRRAALALVTTVAFAGLAASPSQAAAIRSSHSREVIRRRKVIEGNKAGGKIASAVAEGWALY